MARKVWTFEIEDGRHTVELEHGYWSGKRIIRMDGKVVQQTGKIAHLFDAGSEHRFLAGEHSFVIYIRPSLIHFQYDLAINGHSVQTGSPVTKERSGCLTAVLLLAMTINPIAGVFYLVGPILSPALTPMALWMSTVLALLSLLNTLFVLAIWRWKKWGFYALCASAFVILMINIFAGVPILLALFGLLGIGFLYLLLRPVWKYLQ
jgi:hypothetical protein